MGVFLSMPASWHSPYPQGGNEEKSVLRRGKRGAENSLEEDARKSKTIDHKPRVMFTGVNDQTNMSATRLVYKWHRILSHAKTL